MIPKTSIVSKVWTFPVFASGRNNSKIFPLETTISCILVPAKTQHVFSADNPGRAAYFYINMWTNWYAASYQAESNVIFIDIDKQVPGIYYGNAQ